MLETTKKEIQEILKTSKYSTERAHKIENLVDSYISAYANDYDDCEIQMVDDPQTYMNLLKKTNDKDDVYYLLIELKKATIEIGNDCTLSNTIRKGVMYCNTVIGYEHYELEVKEYHTLAALELFINYLEEGALQWNTY